MIGYKATDKDIQCRGYQFVPGQWHELEGEIKLCSSGFHFCAYPSGPWLFYAEEGTRLWKVEAEEVSEESSGDGSEKKHVCRRIRLVEEIAVDGNRNTGDYNTGNYNTGDCNTGNYNTGDYNTGNYNTGNYNTGDCNTGNYNTGDYNTGNYNTGDYNTGNRNTGNCNATNHSSGYFCVSEPPVICFDVDTGLSHDDFRQQYPQWLQLGRDLQDSGPIDFARYSSIPGITPEKLDVLHKKILAAKK